MLCCGRCGRRLVVAYVGRGVPQAVYRCDRPNLMLAQPRCFTFGGRRPDEAIARELLRAVEPLAIEAALQAERRHMEVQADQRRISELELQQARYEASLAERRYAACDLDNRLIAAQLEKSWESALQRALACEHRLTTVEQTQSSEKSDLAGLAEDLAVAWNAPGVTMRARQQLLRTLVKDIVADVDDATREVVLTIHWRGGQHSQVKACQATHGRTWLSHARRSVGRDAQHSGQVVRRTHYRDTQPHGLPNWSGQYVDRAPRGLYAHGQRHSRVPVGAQGR